MKKNLLYSIPVIVILTILMTCQLFAQGEFETGKIAATVSGAGRIKIFAPDFETEQINRISLLVAMNDTAVFDYTNDGENVDTSRVIQSPQHSDHEIYVAADNSWAYLPPAILERINIYGWDNSGFCVVRIRVRNDELESMNAILGLELIVKVDGDWGFETIDFIDGTVVSHVENSTHTGLKIFSAEMTSLRSINWYDGYSDLDSNFYNWVTYGKIDTSTTSLDADGLVSFMSQDAVPLDAGAETEFWIGVAVGADVAAVQTNLDSAALKYEDLKLATSITQSINSAPEKFALNQNYPNPFNPETKISFELPVSEMVTLKVSNLLGQNVATLVNNTLNAGSYQFVFNAANLPSGLYFYTLQAGSHMETKKMILIK